MIKEPKAWEKNDKIDTSFSFLEGFIKKQVFKSGKVYNPELKLSILRPTEGKDDILLTKYTKEQIENNMKKIIPVDD